MFQCPMCPRQLKSRSGLSGHLQFKHGTKLRALEAAPQQLGPAPAKAFEAAPSAVLLEHVIDGLECTVYMIETDVGQLILAIDMQEVILWDIVTNVGILQAAIKAQSERWEKTMELMTQGMTKLTADVDVLTRVVVQLKDNIETLAINRHPPGFCQERLCTGNCHIRLKELEAGTVKLIDNRFRDEELKKLGF